MSPFKRYNQAGGWTYLWLLMIVALMGLGLATAVQIDATAARREKEAELLAIGHQFRNAILRYRQAPGMVAAYPASLDALLADSRFNPPRRYLRKIFVDPITGKAEWGVVIVDGGIVGVHSLSPMMPIKQDGFDTEDAAFRGQQRYSVWVFGDEPR
jgi:hypothetical protein